MCHPSILYFTLINVGIEFSDYSVWNFADQCTKTCRICVGRSCTTPIYGITAHGTEDQKPQTHEIEKTETFNYGETSHSVAYCI